MNRKINTVQNIYFILIFTFMLPLLLNNNVSFTIRDALGRAKYSIYTTEL